MKKLFSMLLACLLALTLPVLAESTEAFSPVGTWYLIGASAQGVTVSPEQLGMEMSITLNEDGTALLTLTGEEDSTGSWTSDGSTVTVDDGADVIELSVNEDGTLSGEAGGAIMIFATEIPEATPAAAPLEAVALEDFNGEWVAFKGVAMGAEVPLESLGLNMTFQIADGSVTVLSNGVGGTVPAALEGNALVVNASPAISLYLYDDGTMAFTQESSGMSVDIFFAKSNTEMPETAPAIAPLETVALEDFNGEWVAVKGMMMGAEVSLESLGMNMSLLIEDGAITPTTDGVAEETVQGTLEGNALLFTDDGVTVGLQLYEDGTMAFTLDLSGSSIDIVFEKTEAAAE